jgi:hypothetical protein
MWLRAVQEVAPQQYMSAEEQRNVDLEALLRQHYRRTPFRCSVGVSADGQRLAAVGIKLHGDSVHRRGRWTRCAVAASCENLVDVDMLPELAMKLRGLYQEFAGRRHHRVNFFHPRRRTRSMKGK